MRRRVHRSRVRRFRSNRMPFRAEWRTTVAVEHARTNWTEVAINEYRAVASFSEVLRALVDVKAPLDLLGMTSDFLADECSHVELASRMAMELGGAVERIVDLDGLTGRPRGLTGMRRANELVLRVSCISEAFSGGTASVSHATTSHPLPRAVYETILRDEAHHRRLGGLYFEWALSRIDEEELHRLGRVLFGSLKALSPFWTRRGEEHRPAPLAGGRPAGARVARARSLRARRPGGRRARHPGPARDHRDRDHARRARRAARLKRSSEPHRRGSPAHR